MPLNIVGERSLISTKVLRTIHLIQIIPNTAVALKPSGSDRNLLEENVGLFLSVLSETFPTLCWHSDLQRQSVNSRSVFPENHLPGLSTS